MIWTLIFVVSIAQGFFLLSVILYRKSNNPLASYLIAAIVAVIIIINADFLVTTPTLYKQFYNFHGFSFGIMFLMSPLFYFYTQSILDENYKWQNKNLWHFIPYLVKTVDTFTFFTMPSAVKLQVLDDYVIDQMPLRDLSILSLSAQIIHLGIYLFFTKKLIHQKSAGFIEMPYLISYKKRKIWLNILFYSFLAYFFSYTFWFGVVAIRDYFLVLADYINAMIMSALVYFIAFKSTLDPELVTPDFLKKYNAQAQISDENSKGLIQKLNYLMDERKLYLDPTLDLNNLAKAMEIPSYQCSRLLNDKFGKGFFDFINDQRINEVKLRLKDPTFQHFSILGIALETGFTSKSSFNTAFKKITGITPSSYKKSELVC